MIHVVSAGHRVPLIRDARAMTGATVDDKDGGEKIGGRSVEDAEESRESTYQAPTGPPCSRGKDSPRRPVPGVEHTPGKVPSWQKTATTRGGSVLSLHYPDQAFNAGDDGLVSGKSTACQAYL